MPVATVLLSHIRKINSIHKLLCMISNFHQNFLLQLVVMQACLTLPGCLQANHVYTQNDQTAPLGYIWYEVAKNSNYIVAKCY